jgi:diguanylate cyclase (GGDEF)-like protein
MTPHSVESIDSSSHEALMQFLYRAPIGLVQTTLDGAIEMINPMSASLLIPLSRTGFLNNLFDVLHDAAPQLRDMVVAFDRLSGTVCESLRIALPVTHKPQIAQILSISLVKLYSMRLMAMVSDVSLEVKREQETLASRLSVASRMDAVTHMPTRAVACEAIQQAIARTTADPGCDVAVIFINCDRFKQINDVLGHAGGDELLGKLAERLRSSVRQFARSSRPSGSEPVIARIGGDEFVLLITDLYFPDDIHAVVQRLLTVLGKSYSVHSHEIFCQVSIGVILRPQITGDADTVLQNAGTAMAEAKRAGGARYVVFEPAMAERAARRSIMESELRHALLEEELFVVYQPVVRFATADRADGYVDRFAGVEALVRWRHPSRGVVPPLEFIGLAEECGLIGAIGDVVLGIACRDFVRWQRELGSKSPRHLAVNLSRGQLGQPGFLASVEHVLTRTGMSPRHLQLEVTESLAAQDQSVQTTLRNLKSMGLTLALDDFGTGYSSLSSLHLLPVDTLKLDRSFVSDAVTSVHHRVLIEATVKVANSLGMDTVAEGIETLEQARVVRQLGCVKGQGYLFGRPMPTVELVKWLEAETSAASEYRESMDSAPQ